MLGRGKHGVLLYGYLALGLLEYCYVRPGGSSVQGGEEIYVQAEERGRGRVTETHGKRGKRGNAPGPPVEETLGGAAGDR